MFRRLIVSLGLVFLLAASPLHAAVTLTFYSKELGASFPHAFVDLQGTIDAGGAPVASTFGFTAKRLSPAILMGDVEGVVEPVTDAYKRGSEAHFSILLTDEQYRNVLATVEKWRTMPGKSYNLNRRNCVFFVGDIARAAGLAVVEDPKLMKKPHSFTQSIARLNNWVTLANPAVPPGRAAASITSTAAAAAAVKR